MQHGGINCPCLYSTCHFLNSPQMPWQSHSNWDYRNNNQKASCLPIELCKAPMSDILPQNWLEDLCKLCSKASFSTTSNTIETQPDSFATLSDPFNKSLNRMSSVPAPEHAYRAKRRLVRRDIRVAIETATQQNALGMQTTAQTNEESPTSCSHLITNEAANLWLFQDLNYPDSSSIFQKPSLDFQSVLLFPKPAPCFQEPPSSQRLAPYGWC